MSFYLACSDVLRYPYYLLQDDNNTWDPYELKDEIDKYRYYYDYCEMTDEEYYSKKWEYRIVGLTETGKFLFVKAAIAEMNRIMEDTRKKVIPFSVLDIDLDPWNDPDNEPSDYISGYGNPEIDGRDYIRRRYLNEKNEDDIKSMSYMF